MQKNIYSFYFFIFFLSFPFHSFNQNLRTNHELNFLKEQFLSPDSNFHFTIKPYTPKDFFEFKKTEAISVRSEVLNNFINKDLFNVEKENVSFRINPLVHLQTAYDFNAASLFSGYRGGLSVNIKLKDKLFFMSDVFFSETQFPSFQKSFTDSFGIIPHYGQFISTDEHRYSFFYFNGEFTYQPSEYIYFHVGNGRHFFGNGFRSLFLSDNSNSYPYFKTTVDIWKIKYIWLLAKLSDFELYNGTQTYNLYDKAAFIHYFSINFTKRINFNFFEAVISNPYDSGRHKIGYDAAYFNPVVFYRPVEFFVGTADNSLMGVGLNLRLFKSLHLYSQFILDDLIISRLNDGSGWWGNKFGIQTGLKAYNFFNVDGLFFRGELNIVRPYTYSHGITISEDAVSNINYGNMHQNLAHPLGGNFAEAISVLRYSVKRFTANAKIVVSKKGTDFDTASYGGDIYKAYNLRPGDYGISFLQGELTSFTFVDFHVSYLVTPNYNLRFEVGAYRRKEINDMNSNNHSVFYFGLSSKLFNEQPDF